MKKRVAVLMSLAFIVAGCALPNQPYKDADKDGVVDSRDVCPYTPLLAKVDRYGCALDSDKDGVIDLYDKCPNTPLTALVDATGCSIKR